MKSEYPAVSVIELNKSLLDYGIDGHIYRSHSDPHTVIGNGRVFFERRASGVGIHCTDIRVKQSGISSTHRGACFVVNILLEGEVKYSLGNKEYLFTSAAGPVAFVSVFQKNELFTRTLHAGQYIKKVNVEVSKEWLFERCKQGDDEVLLNELFANHSKVFSWLVNEELLSIAKQLLTNHEGKELCQQVQSEHFALLILSESLRNVKSRAVVEGKTLTVNKSASQPLSDSVLDAVMGQQALAEVAREQGMSMSTLQRRFRAQFNMSIKEYVRKTRLENARKAIVIDRVSIGEAAFMAGYSHVGNFVTAFRKQFQETPAALRASLSVSQ